MPDLMAVERPFEVRADDDLVQPFVLEVPGLRGRLLRSGPMVDTILSRHDYPQPVAQQLGELLALAAVLASMLKYDGLFTLQLKGDGPLHLMVADVTADGEMRGYAEVDRERLARRGNGGDVGHGVAALMGHGHLAFTVDQGPDTERYQGIVELEGASLADCVQHYFRQSEQLKTAVRVAAVRRYGRWRAGGLLLQQMPEARSETPVLGSDVEDDWRRALVLMASCREAELVDPALSAEALLYHLFHEERVRVFEPRPVIHGCRCSRQRIELILRSMPRAEVLAMKGDDDEVDVTCQFCNRCYRFDEDALAALYEG